MFSHDTLCSQVLSAAAAAVLLLVALLLPLLIVVVIVSKLLFIKHASVPQKRKQASVCK
jgi:hypothetical protein